MRRNAHNSGTASRNVQMSFFFHSAKSFTIRLITIMNASHIFMTQGFQCILLIISGRIARGNGPLSQYISSFGCSLPSPTMANYHLEILQQTTRCTGYSVPGVLHFLQIVSRLYVFHCLSNVVLNCTIVEVSLSWMCSLETCDKKQVCVLIPILSSGPNACKIMESCGPLVKPSVVVFHWEWE